LIEIATRRFTSVDRWRDSSRFSLFRPPFLGLVGPMLAAIRRSQIIATGWRRWPMDPMEMHCDRCAVGKPVLTTGESQSLV